MFLHKKSPIFLNLELRRDINLVVTLNNDIVPYHKVGDDSNL